MTQHRKFDPEFKSHVIMEVLTGVKTAAEICREYNLRSGPISNWKAQLTHNAANAFQSVKAVDLTQARIDKDSGELIETQKKLIEELQDTLEVYKKILKEHGLSAKYKHLPGDKKWEIIQSVEKSDLPISRSLKKQGVARSSFYSWKQQLQNVSQSEGQALGSKKKKYQAEEYKAAVFAILHAPPKDYGFNRTTWRIQDIHAVMKSKGLPLGKNYIMRVIKNEGYRFKNAKIVLTSTDPEYKEKLNEITAILSNLSPNDRFFSIDEFGPFAIKMQGGKSYMPPGQTKTVPQFQKSKGSLIMTGALELSTNQMTYFYSIKKDTEEMIRLLELIVSKYSSQDCIYFSWDAASWHTSKRLCEKIDAHNKTVKRPIIKLAPLPACAQFLNVIESVFSGMAKAIIHNSDYQSVEECKQAIDRYFKERNEYYQLHPKKAGNKLWGKEIVPPVFCESNNCKDPKYSR